MKYVVRAEVYGGVTGHRVALCKSRGQVITFDTREEAEEYADKCRKAVSPYAVATFRYTVQEDV